MTRHFCSSDDFLGFAKTMKKKARSFQSLFEIPPVSLSRNQMEPFFLFQSSDFFELAPKDQPIELDLSADQTQQSIYQNPRSSRIGMASSYPQGPNSFNSANVLPAENSSRVSYPLSRHSYTTPQPPFVNRFKIRKEKEPVTQIMTQPTPGHDYNLSPIPPSNSAVPPHENENDTQEGYGKEFASANVASHLE